MCFVATYHTFLTMEKPRKIVIFLIHFWGKERVWKKYDLDKGDKRNLVWCTWEHTHANTNDKQERPQPHKMQTATCECQLRSTRKKLHLFLSCDCHNFTVAVNAYLSVAVICLAHPAKQYISTSLHILSTSTTQFQAQKRIMITPTRLTSSVTTQQWHSSLVAY